MDKALIGLVLLPGLVALALSFVLTYRLLQSGRKQRCEDARRVAQEQQRARYLEFLNRVSKTAMSIHDSDVMLAEIVAEMRANFDFEHIGIGVLDPVTKEIEIKAEAGTTTGALGKRAAASSAGIGRLAPGED